MDQWVGAPGQVKIAKNTPLMTFPPENPYRKRKIFFSILTTGLAESVEGLNSSLAQSPGELYDCKALHETWFSQDLKGWCEVPFSLSSSFYAAWRSAFSEWYTSSGCGLRVERAVGWHLILRPKFLYTADVFPKACKVDKIWAPEWIAERVKFAFCSASIVSRECSIGSIFAFNVEQKFSSCCLFTW